MPRANDLADALKHAEMDPLLKDHLMKIRGEFVKGRRMKMQILPLLFAVFLPFGFFLLSSAVMSFGVHCQSETLAWTVIAGLVLLWFGMLQVSRYFRRHDPNPTWYSTLTLFCFFTIIGGTAVGNYNFYVNYRPYCIIQDMQVVKNVNASAENGQTYMDAGIFQFSAGTHLAHRKTWHFKNGHVYCVAPIVGTQIPPETGSWDFWAVGKDCCSTVASDFRCGAYDKPTVLQAGRRVMKDKDRLFYRLAVEQAESLYGIKASFPIFMYWEENPLIGVNQWLEDSYHLFYLGLITCFTFLFVFTAIAGFCFAFLGRNPYIKREEDPEPDQAENTYSDGMYYAQAGYA